MSSSDKPEQRKEGGEETKQPPKNSMQRLTEWQQQHRIPLEYGYLKDTSGQGKGFVCSIRLLDTEEPIVKGTGRKKADAGQAAASAFFEAHHDEAVLKETKPLLANNLTELCARLAISDFVYAVEPVNKERLAMSQTVALTGRAKSAADAGHPLTEREIKAMDKSIKKMLDSKDEWLQSTIRHPLWAPGCSVSALGESIADARQRCELRVLRQCMDDPKMFQSLVMPDSECCRPASLILEGDRDSKDKPEIVVLTAAELADSVLKDDIKANKTLARFQQTDLLGIDCERFVESAPAPTKKQTWIGTIQISNGNLTVVCQVSRFRKASDWPPLLLRMLESSDYRRYTVDFVQDRRCLDRMGADVTRYFDLQNTAARFPEFNKKPGLAMLAARLLRLNLAKDEALRRSDWSATTLTPEQVRYAALDAMITLLVALALERRTAAKPTDPMYFKTE